MSVSDVTLYCNGCHQPFTFSAREQMFYASKNIINPPTRCETCRATHKAQQAQNQAQTKQVQCQDCGQLFDFTYGEQQYFASHSLSDPTRCKECRAKQKATQNNTQGNTAGQPRQLYPAVCTDCGQQTQVPFQPKPGRAIYCRVCYSSHKTAKQ